MREPTNISELMDYIEHYATSIFIREQVSGEWDAYSLAKLPGDLAIKHTLRFLREGVIPVRVRSEEEIAEASR